MGIKSPSEIFPKHGDKMIFKNPTLSPSKIYGLDRKDIINGLRYDYLLRKMDGIS